MYSLLFQFSNQQATNKSRIFSLSPLKYHCKAATLINNVQVLSDARIPARIWDFQEEKEEEKEMGKFLVVCGSDLISCLDY